MLQGLLSLISSKYGIKYVPEALSLHNELGLK